MTDAAALCARHALDLREVFPSNFGLVARVRDSEGRNLLLKASQSFQHDCLDEGLALQAWQSCDSVPELVAMFPDGSHLREFIVGVALAQLPDAGRRHARDAGRLLRELHQPTLIPGAPETWLGVEADKLARSAYLSDAMRQRACRLAEVLISTPGRTLVHGDFYSRNILLAERGLVAIDPLARHDLPAADIALYAITSPDTGVESVLQDVLEGYLSEPPAVREYVEFWALRNAHYRGEFEARADDSARWQPCFVATGDGMNWVG